MPSYGSTRRGVTPRLSAFVIMAVLAASQLIIAIDYNIVYVALPSISTDLGFDSHTLQWVISAYALTFGGFLLLGGRASDLLSKRSLFIVALGLYAGGSIAGGLAENQALLIVARMVQGLGGALLFPATLSIINTTFAEGRDRNKALAIWGAAGASGGALGALLGGLITSGLGWRWTFFIIVPVAAVVAVLALRFLPRSEPSRTTEPTILMSSPIKRYDIPGSITVTLASLLLVFGLVSGPQAGWTSGSTIAAFVGAAVFFAIFFTIEARTTTPLMPLRMFRNRSLAMSAVLAALFMGSFGGQFFLLTTWLQDVHQFSPVLAGFAIVPLAVAIIVGTNVGSRLSNRFGFRVAAAIGLGTGVIGLIAVGLQISPDVNYAVRILPWLVLDGIGQGITWTAMWIAASTGVQAKEQGIASGITSTAQQVGGAVGLAVLVAISSIPLGSNTASPSEVNAGLSWAFITTAGIAAIGVVTALVGLPRHRAYKPETVRIQKDEVQETFID